MPQSDRYIGMTFTHRDYKYLVKEVSSRSLHYRVTCPGRVSLTGAEWTTLMTRQDIDLLARKSRIKRIYEGEESYV